MTITEPSTPYVVVDDLEVTYSTKRDAPVTALSGLSLTIDRGQFISVVGPSGCGKSTFLKVAAGLLSASAGHVSIDGRVVQGTSRDIGIVFQTPVLLPWRNILENTMIVPNVQHLDQAAHRERARELLDMVGLSGFEKKYPNELSGGMQQRAGVVRALVSDPPMLLMDEPFGALDALTREQLNVDLQRIWMQTGKTVIFITHSVTEAVFLGDRVVVMGARPGRMLEDITIDLPRPRALSDMAKPEFGKYADHVRDLLGVGTVSVG
jgi:NitT/TauT family transport system ATP-binding protein